MSIALQNPWRLFDQLQYDMNRAYTHKAKNEDNVAHSDWTPAVDIKEEDNQYLLIADIPGVNANEIDIQMDSNILSIKGERNSEFKNERNSYNRVERKHGVFYRRFTMPDDINAEGINAKCDNGVLIVSIPKQEAIKPRKITID